MTTNFKYNVNRIKESTISSECEDYDEQYNPEIQARVPKLTEKEKREVLKRILKNNPVVKVCRTERELEDYFNSLGR